MKFKQQNKIILGAFSGIIVFIMIFGFYIINPQNDNWIYSTQDFVTHYRGWQFYRNSQWFFPIGLMDNINYPNKISIIYSDAIPLFAIIFKLFSKLLPETFQYFGLWGIICYILQGVFGILILKKYIKNTYSLIVSNLFLLLSPLLLQRIYMHSALAAHWIILAAIYLYENIEQLSIKKSVIYWGILFILSSLIHIYFLPILCVFLFYFYIDKSLKDKEYIGNFLLFIPILLAFMSLYIVGGFYGGVDYNIGGLGTASTTLTSFFNSLGYSKYLKPLEIPEIICWKEESFCYLGLGIIIILFISIFKCMYKLKIKKLNIKGYEKKIIFYLMLCITFGILSTMPTVFLGNRLIFSWSIPQIFEEILSIFRSVGRFIWPTWYIVVIFLLVNINKIFLFKKSFFILFICFFIQILDLQPIIKMKNDQVKNYPKNYFNIPEIPKRCFEDYKYIWVPNTNNWEKTTLLAINNNLKINQTYLARKNNLKTLKYIDKTIDNLKNGLLNVETVYVILPDYIPWLLKSEIYIYQVGELYIATKNKLKIDDKFLISNNILKNKNNVSRDNIN